MISNDVISPLPFIQGRGFHPKNPQNPLKNPNLPLPPCPTRGNPIVSNFEGFLFQCGNMGKLGNPQKTPSLGNTICISLCNTKTHFLSLTIIMFQQINLVMYVKLLTILTHIKYDGIVFFIKTNL